MDLVLDFISLVGILSKMIYWKLQNIFSMAPITQVFFISYIVLIPKVNESTIFGKFRSISLCSIPYKIFSKVIVGRLIICLNIIISLEKGVFLLGCNIFENITLAQKMVHSSIGRT